MSFLQRPGWFGKQLKENIQKLINGDYSAALRIFCVLTEKHDPSKFIAAEALHAALVSFQFADIMQIDTQMRQTTSMEWSINWREISIDSLWTRDMSPDLRRAVIIFASFHPNGFLREQAVRMMGNVENTLSFIILRQNDWVWQVRLAAEQSFQSRLTRLSSRELLNALPFAQKIKGCKYSDSMQVFFDHLTSPEHREDLLKGLQSSQIRTRRLCVRVMLESVHIDTNLMRNCISSEADPFLRKMIFEHLCALGENMYGCARIFLRDTYPPNRLLALQYLYALHPMDTPMADIAMNHLLDKNSRVRAAARKMVSELMPGFEFAAFYRRHLEDAVVAAVSGIGETGRLSDCAELENYLSDNQPSVVCATIAALMRLHPEQYGKLIVSFLDHPSPSVVQTVQRLMMKHRVTDYAEIQSILDTTAFLHAKIKCAALLFAAPKWQSIIYMLQVLRDGQEQLQGMTIQAINKWLFSFNRSYYQATNQQKERIRQLVQECRGRLAAPAVQGILFLSE